METNRQTFEFKSAELVTLLMHLANFVKRKNLARVVSIQIRQGELEWLGTIVVEGWVKDGARRL